MSSLFVNAGIQHFRYRVVPRSEPGKPRLECAGIIWKDRASLTISYRHLFVYEAQEHED